MEDLEKALEEEIEAVKKDGITQQELEKVRTQFLRNAIQTRQGALAKANQIGTFTIYYNDPNLINTAYEKLTAVTAEARFPTPVSCQSGRRWPRRTS